MRTITSKIKSTAQNNEFWAHILGQLVRIFFHVRFFLLCATRKRNFFIDSSVRITGWRNILLSPNCAISRYTWLNVNDRKTNGKAIVIGKNTFIGEYNFFSAGKEIILGEYVTTTSHCAFIGSSHIIENPFKPYISTGTTLKSSIHIGANCFFGFGSQVIGDVTIGFGSIIGAGAVVKSHIPPLSIVVGNPGKIIKRYSIIEKRWIKIEDFNENITITEEEYLEKIKSNANSIILPISAAASKWSDI